MPPDRVMSLIGIGATPFWGSRSDRRAFYPGRPRGPATSSVGGSRVNLSEAAQVVRSARSREAGRLLQEVQNVRLQHAAHDGVGALQCGLGGLDLDDGLGGIDVVQLVAAVERRVDAERQAALGVGDGLEPGADL